MSDTETITNKAGRKFKVEIEQDCDPFNPRTEYDNAATMYCAHSRYNLGDEFEFDGPSAVINAITGVDGELINSEEDAVNALDNARIVYLPLHLYDHSGITISTKPFSCPWDSGQVGFIVMTYKQVQEAFGIEPIDPDKWEPLDGTVEKAYELMRGEVKTYDQYLTGDVYGYKIYAHDYEQHDGDITDEDETEELESCWGFYGENAAREAAHEAANAL